MIIILKSEHFYKYYFEELSPVIFRNSRHCFEFLLYEMFLGLPLDTDLKVTKIQKTAGISVYYRTKTFKIVFIKNVHL